MIRIFLKHTVKPMLMFISIAYSFSSASQSIIGKWKLADTKEIITDKSTGKTQDLGAQIKPMLKMMEQVFVFNTDNSYSFSNSMVGDPDKIEVSGTYNVSGNRLKLNQAKTNMPAVDKNYLIGHFNA